MRAPTFYDSNNTAYYINPNGTSYCFRGAGSILVNGNITAYSDRRVKEDIQNIPNALAKVLTLNGVTFSRNDMEDTVTRYGGLIAQELQEVLPEAVRGDETQTGRTLSVDYNATIGLLVESIKELTSKVNDLETKLNEKDK